MSANAPTFTPPLGVPATQVTPGQSAPVAPAPSKALVPSPPIKMGERGMVVKDRVDLFRLADDIIAGGLAPKGYTKREQVVGAMMMGAELGLPPTASLRVIAVINGMPSAWGNGSYAIAMEHDEYERHEVTWKVDDQSEEMEFPPEFDKLEEIPSSVKCICRVWRKGIVKPFAQKFSVGDAKLAGLWMATSQYGQPMPWSLYWWKMIYHKAVGNAFDMAIPGAFIGLNNAPPEEVSRITGADVQEGKITEFPAQPMTLKQPLAPRPAPETPPGQESIDAEFTVTNQVSGKDYVSDEPKQSIPPASETPAEPKKKRKASVKETVNPQDATPPEPIKEPEKPADKTEQTVNQIMAEFRECNPLHHRSRMTVDNDKVRWVKCDCGAAWKVEMIGSIVTFPSNHPGDGTCEPKDDQQAPATEAKAPFKYVGPVCEGLSVTGRSFHDEIMTGKPFDICEVFGILTRKIAQTKEKTALAEVQFLCENAIVKMLDHDKSITTITKVSGWINDIKAKMPSERIEVLRELLKSLTAK